ncbi:hypothetical protein [uncultured Helicobacter sp.]|uniref:hypothetical protein n=1 Tax=uncultured Helicobacter sp. TaxID=175537 RepID=UPI0026219F34|nr:hypothetical protein [uncultured Helicobacter sp.]
MRFYKLYFELGVMIVVSVTIFSVLMYHFFSYGDILSFISNLWLLILILAILLIGIFDTLKGIKRYKKMSETRND